jgi:hypothetical protein
VQILVQYFTKSLTPSRLGWKINNMDKEYEAKTNELIERAESGDEEAIRELGKRAT